ncbi:MAG: adenosylcobinamide kinase [Lachnospiraceae bacterium]|nr:adenosylcobinamide kinase [Lachnospiraceae bacterium]
MVLVTGGAFQGKKAYAMETFSLEEAVTADGASCFWDDIYRAQAILHFHEYIRRCLEAGREVDTLADRLFRRNPEAVIVVNELGSGVVPVEAFDRHYRETTGRICCELAKRASEVHRVVCGIGTVIKNG